MLSLRSWFVPATRLYCSSFPFLPRLSSQRLPRCSSSPHGFLVFPVLLRLVSHTLLSVLSTWRSVGFLSSFPASLPQPFHWCSDSFHLSASILCFAMPPLSFVRFSLGSDYSAFCFFLSLLPGFPSQWFFPVLLLFFNFRLSVFPWACYQPSVPTLVLGFPAIPFPVFLLRITGATAVSGLLFPARPLPLAFALGSSTWAG